MSKYANGEYVKLKAVPEQNLPEEIVRICGDYHEPSETYGYSGWDRDGFGTHGECSDDEIIGLADLDEVTKIQNWTCDVQTKAVEAAKKHDFFHN